MKFNDSIMMIFKLYELIDDSDSVITKSFKLSVFETQINDTSTKVILNIDAITIYISQRFAAKIKVKITKIAF